MNFNFIIQNENKEKKNIIIINQKGRVLSFKYSMQDRFLFETGRILAKDFNVYFISESSAQFNAENEVIKAYKELNFIGIESVKFEHYNKSTSENPVEDNKKLAMEIIEKHLKDKFKNNVVGILISPSFSSSQVKDAFDCIEEKDIEKANKYVKKINEKIENGSFFHYSLNMFKHQAISNNIVQWLYENNKNANVYTFVIDSNEYWHYYKDFCNGKTYYFENDKRGNRDFYQFPIAQLTHLIGFEKEHPIKLTDKPKDFIWGGTFFRQNGDRIKDFVRLIGKIDFENSDLYLSNTASLRKNKNYKYGDKFKENEYFEEALKLYKENPIKQDILSVHEYEEKLANDYKYSVLLKSVAAKDTLGFRMYYNTYYNVLSFVADNYDIGGLQIPKHLKEKLVVSSSEEIKEKIEYYNKNLQEAEKLLKEIKDYYFDEKYFSDEWYLKEFRENYFKELYK